MKEVRGITINTDASFYEQFKVGGYAFWIKSCLFTIKGSNQFKTDINSPLVAEIYAIGNAIACLLKNPDLPKAGFLQINTDCTEAIKHITRQLSPEGREVNRLWGELIRKIGSTKNTIKHVKGHSNRDNARTYVNNWCDSEARKWAREAIKLKQRGS